MSGACEVGGGEDGGGEDGGGEDGGGEDGGGEDGGGEDGDGDGLFCAGGLAGAQGVDDGTALSWPADAPDEGAVELP